MDIYFGDFEALTGNSSDYKKQKHTDIIYYAIADINENFVSEAPRADNFYKWLITLKRDSVIYFHNLSFDGVFICNLLYRKKWNYINNFDWEYAEKFNYSCMKTNNKIYKITIKVARNIEVNILCSYLLLSNSIEALGKTLKLNKKDKYIERFGYQNFLDYASYNLDRNPEHKKKYIEYCKRDIIIMLRSYKNFYKTLKANNFLNYYYRNELREINIYDFVTVGQLIKKIAFNFLIDTGFNRTKLYVKYDQYNFLRRFLKGGLTQFNRLYVNEYVEKPVTIIDVVSSYPDSMRQLLPTSELLINKPKGHYIEWVIVNIKYGIIKKEWEHIPALKCNIICNIRYFGKGSIIFPDTYYFAKIEWDIIKQFYDMNYTEEVYYTTAEPFLKNFIEHLYTLKENAKSKTERQTFKICLNAFYGKLLQSPDNDSQYFAYTNELTKLIEIKKFEIKDDPYYVSGQSISATGAICNKLCHVKIKMDKLEKNTNEINPLIGAYITSLSRVKLLRGILTIPPKNFLYCATDSIFFINFKGWEKFFKFGEELGSWEIEKEGDAFKVLGANRYQIFKDGKPIKTGFGGLTNLSKEVSDKYFKKDKYETMDIDNCSFKKIYDEYGIILERQTKTFKNEGKN